MPVQPKRRKLGKGEKVGAAWGFAIGTLYAPVSGAIRIRYEHIDRVPATGPAILVANHVAHVEPLVLAKMVIDAGRVPRFLAKDAIFDVPVVGAVMRSMGNIPVKRGTADAAQSFASAVAQLAEGKVIVIHPEGTVTRDPQGWPMAGKTGAARLALLAPDVPVIPVAQWGVQESIDLYQKKVKLFPRPHHTVSVGEPIDLSQWRAHADGQGTSTVLREMTDAIMKRLRADVAALRGVPEPEGELFVWTRPPKNAG